MGGDKGLKSLLILLDLARLLNWTCGTLSGKCCTVVSENFGGVLMLVSAHRYILYLNYDRGH